MTSFSTYLCEDRARDASGHDARHALSLRDVSHELPIPAVTTVSAIIEIEVVIIGFPDASLQRSGHATNTASEFCVDPCEMVPPHVYVFNIFHQLVVPRSVMNALTRAF
jgi:hypothetical protein